MSAAESGVRGLLPLYSLLDLNIFSSFVRGLCGHHFGGFPSKSSRHVRDEIQRRESKARANKQKNENRNESIH